MIGRFEQPAEQEGEIHSGEDQFVRLDSDTFYSGKNFRRLVIVVCCMFKLVNTSPIVVFLPVWQTEPKSFESTNLIVLIQIQFPTELGNIAEVCCLAFSFETLTESHHALANHWNGYTSNVQTLIRCGSDFDRLTAHSLCHWMTDGWICHGACLNSSDCWSCLLALESNFCVWILYVCSRDQFELLSVDCWPHSNQLLLT